MRVVVVLESSNSVSKEVTLANSVTYKELWRYFTTLKGQRIKCWELIHIKKGLSELLKTEKRLPAYPVTREEGKHYSNYSG